MMKKLIFINLLIVILEAFIIYEYLKLHMGSSQEGGGGAGIGEKIPPPKRLVVSNTIDPAPIPRPPLPTYKCPSCSFHSVKNEKEIDSLIQSSSETVDYIVFLFHHKLNHYHSKQFLTYPIYRSIYHPSIFEKEERYFIVQSHSASFEEDVLPLTNTTSHVLSFFATHLFYTIDCWEIFEFCWKYQLNHHSFPFFVVFTKLPENNSNNIEEIRSQYLMSPSVPTPMLKVTEAQDQSSFNLRFEGENNKMKKIETTEQAINNLKLNNTLVELFHDSNSSTPLAEEKKPHPLHFFIPTPDQQPSISSISAQNKTTIPLKKFPGGIYFFKNNPLIQEITDQDFFGFLQEINPTYPKILLLYSDICEPCRKFVKLYQGISGHINQYLSDYNNDHPNAIERIPFIHFYAMNVRHFNDNSQLLPFLQLTPDLIEHPTPHHQLYLPRIFSIHFHKIQEKFVKNLKIWNPILLEELTEKRKSVDQLIRKLPENVTSSDIEEVFQKSLLNYLQQSYLVFIGK